jgi:glucose/arabinose dehydrogenase
MARHSGVRGGWMAGMAGTVGAVVLLVAVAAASVAGASSTISEQQLAGIQLPPGFRINVFAEGLGYVRMMAFTPAGDLVAISSSRTLGGQGCGGGSCTADDGRVFLLADRDGDGVADRTVTLMDGLDRPSGLAYRDGALYLSVWGRVLRVPERDGTFQADDGQTIVGDLPVGPSHWSRTIAFGPDGKMYVHAGSSCNVCDEEHERRAAITQYNPDGSGQRVFARGLRNAVGLAFQPGTGELWATNNQRDLAGDDFPPEYVSIVRDGDHFGWPFCHVGVPDPEFGHLGSCADTRSPTVLLPAHSAPLGLAFYTGQQFPAEYRGDLFVALHGSWNRTNPQGYKVVRVAMTGGMPGTVSDFATGWLPADGGCNNSAADLARNVPICRGDAWGRPVDLVVGPDGSLFLSDDQVGVIYRITYAP